VVTVGAIRNFESHLISRATFGWTPATERAVLDAGWVGWLDAQLAPTSIPDPAMAQRLAGYQTLTNSNWQNYVFVNSADDGWSRLVAERAHATFLRALHSRRQLYEVMVEFWTNHFNVNLDDTFADHMITVDNREVARAHALGRFVDLLQASAHSPAMLLYLDNAISDANSDEGVNENYGRELLELHTMGIIDGVQLYTEADMRGVALILSGWSVDTDDGQHRFRFKNEMHHAGPVSILGGTFATSGHTGTAGLADGVALLNILARHPATARYIAYKLCRRFVSDTPPPALVTSAAAVYTQNDTAIAPVLRHIFHSSAFAAASRNKVRRGFEILVGSARALDGTAEPDPVGELANHVHGYGWGFLERLGQRLWGHRTPDGYPDTAPDWISADGLLRRWETAGALTATWLDGWTFDADAILTPTGPTVGTWIEGVARRMLGVVTGYPDHGFRDVPAWVEDPVRWITAKRYATGWPDRTYRPNANINRGQVTNMLWKIAGSPTGRPPHGLSDVPAWLEPAVRWAKATNVVSPYGNSTFRPDLNMPRSQVVTASWTMAGGPTGFPNHELTDVPSGLDAAVRWAVACGYMAGFPDDTFKPNDPITRAQVTRMLYRIHDVTPPLLTAAERAACLALFTDVPADADDHVPNWLVAWKGHDLMTLMLTLPRFQRR
jgi:uncharacterized protein (DUF1800 family)